MLTSTSKKIDVNFTPLDVSCNIVPYGGTPDRQVYNSADGGFYPDFANDSPVCLYPECRAGNANDTAQGDDVINGDSVNFSFSWYELAYDKASGKYLRGNAIKTGKDYTVIESSEDGLTRGMLKVKKNAAPNNPIRLEFEANYINPKTGQKHHYLKQKNIYCDDMEAAVPVMHLTPKSSVWNPLKENSKVTFEAILTDGGNNITNDKNVRFAWYRKVNINGNSYDLQQVGTSGVDNIEVLELSTKKALVDGKEIDVPGNTLTVDRNLVGDDMQYVCKAMRRPSLTSSDKFTDRDPMEECSVRRQMPAVKVVALGMPDTSDESQEYIFPSCKVFDSHTGEEYTNFSDFYNVYWMVKKPTDVDFKVVSKEASCQIPFVNGMEVQVGIEDKGASKLAMNGSSAFTIGGKYVTLK